jgi:phosphate/sulfate permease
MKPMSWIGLVVLILGIASLVIPIPHRDHDGFTAGPISVGVETNHSETLSPIVSAVMILGGAGLMIGQMMIGQKARA